MTNKLNLPGFFRLRTEQMLLSIQEGRGLHSRGNLRDSGHPWEQALRALLAESFPGSHRVANGYFYRTNSDVSGEIDILVYEDKEAFTLELNAQGINMSAIVGCRYWGITQVHRHECWVRSVREILTPSGKQLVCV